MGHVAAGQAADIVEDQNDRSLIGARVGRCSGLAFGVGGCESGDPKRSPVVLNTASVAEHVAELVGDGMQQVDFAAAGRAVDDEGVVGQARGIEHLAAALIRESVAGSP